MHLQLCHQCTACDAFQIRQDGRIYMASCATRTRVADPLVEEEDDSVDGDSDREGNGPGGGSLKPHEIIQGLDLEWSYTPVHGDEFEPLFGSNKLLNAIPETYRQLIQHSKKEDSRKTALGAGVGGSSSRADTKHQESLAFTASFSVPSAGIMMLQTLARMVSGRRLVVLMGDKGYTRLSEMRGCYATHISPDMVASLQW